MAPVATASKATSCFCSPCFSQGRPQNSNHQEQPEQQADEQGDLPGSPQVDVLVALMAEVERNRIGHLVVNAQPFAGQRTDHDEQQRQKQDIDAQALSLRFLLADQRADEQPGRQPGRGDPEQAQLNVPRPSHAVRQPLGERKAVEAVSLDAVVRRDDAQQHLHENQSGDDPEVFDRRLLRRRGLPTAERIGFRRNCGSSSASRRDAYHQAIAEIPASSMMMLTPVQTTASPVGRLPTSGSYGQLFV